MRSIPSLSREQTEFLVVNEDICLYECSVLESLKLCWGRSLWSKQVELVLIPDKSMVNVYSGNLWFLNIVAEPRNETRGVEATEKRCRKPVRMASGEESTKDF